MVWEEATRACHFVAFRQIVQGLEMGKKPEVPTSLPHQMHLLSPVSSSIQQTQSLAVFGCAWVCLGPAQIETLFVPHLGPLSAVMSLLLMPEVQTSLPHQMRFVQVLFLPPSSRHNP